MFEFGILLFILVFILLLIFWFEDIFELKEGGGIKFVFVIELLDWSLGVFVAKEFRLLFIELILVKLGIFLGILNCCNCDWISIWGLLLVCFYLTLWLEVLTFLLFGINIALFIFRLIWF